jgi:hypothetical protein
MRRASGRTLRLLLALACAALTSCASLNGETDGDTAPDETGAREELRLCVLAGQGVSREQAHRLMDGVTARFSLYRIDVTVPWIREWTRPAFTGQGIMETLVREPLEAPCDRLLALVSRHLGDFLVGLIGIEVLGAVDNATHTRGFIVAHRASINQILLPPGATLPHEIHHLLGCRDGEGMAACRARIRRIREFATTNRASGSDFFPGISWDGVPLLSRQATDLAAQAWPRRSGGP